MRKISPYAFNIIWLFTLLCLIAWLVGFEPFGDRTLLTIDLKQQYLEFFGYFRHTLLEAPDGFAYSFAKGIGGNMLGLWTYYLLSPFNFLFLLVPITLLPQMIEVVIVLKLLAMSTSFFYFVRQRYALDTIMNIFFSSCYALSAYVVTYYSNVMWLDALILLPIVAVGLHRLLQHRQWQLYVGTLAFLIMTNYYIGYMVCLFLGLYAIFVWSEGRSQWEWRVFWRDYGRFVLYSLLAVGLSSIVLVPTIAALLNSKANYAQSAWNLNTAYSIRDVLAKSFIGSFKLDEIRHGSPQIYVGIGTALLSLYYFVTRPIRRYEKRVAAAILAIFMITFYFKFMDRLWHAGQFPVWYPFRFSFVWCSFLLILAIKAWQQRESFERVRHGIVSLIMIAGFGYYGVHHANFSFLTRQKVILSLVFLAVYGAVFLFLKVRPHMVSALLLTMVSTELVLNAFVVLPKFELASAQETRQQIAAIQDEITSLPTSDSFSRIYKNFNRSRNDALLFAYNGVSHFSSTTQTAMTQLFAALGLAQTSTSAHYTAGTLLTDDLFGIEHILSLHYPKEIPLHASAQDLDLTYYPIVQQSQHFDRRLNADHYGLGVAATAQLKDLSFSEQPIVNQERLLQVIANVEQPIFKEVPITPIATSHITLTPQGYQKSDMNQVSTLLYQFDTTNENPYYIILPKDFSHKKASLYLNEQKFYFYPNFTADQVIAISNGTIGSQQLKVNIPKHQNVSFPELTLYEFDRERYEQLHVNRFVTTAFHHNHIEGEIEVADNQSYVLFSIPYDKNWHITVNQQVIQPQAVLDGTLLAVPVQSGKQQIFLTYHDNSLVIGSSATCFTLVLCYWLTRRQQSAT